MILQTSQPEAKTDTSYGGTDAHTEALLHQMEETRRPYVSTYRGIELVVLPRVFFPLLYSSDLNGVTAADIRTYRGKRVIDVGSGTGIRAVVAGLSGASEVVAIDVNPDAVRNTQMNIDRYGLTDKVIALESDLFENVTGKFDCVVAYLQIVPHEISEDWQVAVFDPGFSIHRRFFREVSDYIKPSSLIKMVHASKGNVELFESMIRDNGLTVSRKKSSKRFGVDWHFYDIRRNIGGQTK